MCGILIVKSEKIDNKIYYNFKKALKILENRGPDETKIFKSKNLLLGFTRLSINDIKKGSQPFQSNCKRYVTAFNGEIVNYKNLLKYLKGKKVNFRIGHEAEVIFNLFKLYGKNCLKYLRGFFAFAIVDLKTNKIFASVDRFSIKPLYYSKVNNGKTIILSSDLTAILKSKLVKERINFEKILEFLTLAREFDNSTFYKDIYKINSSSYININNNIQTKNYWHPFNKKEIKINKNNLIKKLDKLFQEVVKLWKISELKTSLSLSTGHDSKLLNFYLKRNNIKFQSFHIKEKPKSVLDKDILITKVNINRLKKDLNKFFKYSKNPFPLAHASSLSFFEIYKKISKKNYKFTLNGEGSDEIFGGYLRYNRQLNNISEKEKFTKSILNIYKNEIDNIKFLLKKKINIFKFLENKIKKVKIKSKTSENKILEFDQLTWIPSLVQRHDSIGMFYSLEVRPPFLDHKLVEFINSIPAPLKFNLLENKIILKLLMKKKFSYSNFQTKIPTPSLLAKLIKSQSSYKLAVRHICNSKLNKFFNFKKVKSEFKNQSFNRTIFWRLFVISKML